LEILISQFQTRLIFGVQKQLVDLVRISLLNSHRARAFYNAGYTNVASIAMCDLKTVEKILRSSMMFIASGENKPINDQPNKINSETVIWNDGKNYTYYQASNCIIQEANDVRTLF
jgi:DNA polymerase theta